MKKILFLVFAFLFSANITYAANHIYSIDISVYIDDQGEAKIKEIWTVKGSNGSEWYKVLNNLGNSSLSNYEVYMDGTLLKYKAWDINESLREKKGYYGINNTSNSKELCFGKYDYKKHVFTLNYTLSNFVFNVEDAQVIYFNFIDKLTDVDFDNFTLEISTYYNLPDNIDVWGYGYKGYAYVENGKIKMSNEENMDEKYVVLLAKFPLNTFNTNNKYSNFNTFDDVYNMSLEGSFKYDDKPNIFLLMLSFIFNILVFIMVGFLISKFIKNYKYGYINNKKIDKKNTPYFRDIPCNKDIYYANTLANLNGFSKETNILGAIFLKWIKEGIMTIKKDSKDNVSLILNPYSNDNELENKLYSMVYKASIDGILEKKELDKWARKNYSTYLNLFTKIKNNGISKLKSEGHIYKKKYKKECKYNNVMDDTLYEDSKKLYGLKLFLDEFSNISKKEAIDVMLWDEYLMFAMIFGNAKKVMKQFKDLYPEIYEQMDGYNLDFDTLIFLNNLSYNSVSAANSAKAAAESYSAGGGGFSSGGGGMGSFGGGGGGSR